MALDKDILKINFWRLFLSRALSKNLNKILAHVIRQLKRGAPLDQVLVNALLDDMKNSAIRSTNEITRISYNKFIGVKVLKEADLQPLRELQASRALAWNDNINGYKLQISNIDTGILNLGRQHNDIIRNITVKDLELGFIRNDASHFLRKSFVEKINKAAKLPSPIAPQLTKRNIQRFVTDSINQVPVLSKDGTKFLLLEKSKRGIPSGIQGKSFKVWDIQKYADLVAITTTDNARWKANEQRAKNNGTRFIKINRTVKTPTQYRKENDPQCADIDGGTFAVIAETSGTADLNGRKKSGRGAIGKSGKFYLHIREVITSGFAKPHPFCKHQASPLPERFA